MRARLRAVKTAGTVKFGRSGADNASMAIRPARRRRPDDGWRHAAELDALHAAVLALSEELAPEAVLETIVEGASSLVEGSFGYLYLADETGSQLVARVAKGPFAPFTGSGVPLERAGVAGRVWRTGRPAIVNDYRRWPERQRRLRDSTPATVLAVPLLLHGRPAGVIGLAHMDEQRPFSERDEQLVSRFAQLASLALERAELTAELRRELGERRRTEEELLSAVARLTASEAALRRTQEEAVRRLSAAAEYRDGATGSHIERVALHCDLIARRLGLDEAFCEAIRIASPLHDIGKIGIPDAVLLEPGPLDARERALIERHTEIGHRILSGSGSELLELAASIALTHHEHWDGSGYPAGLRGEEIPLEGRIAAVADVFDALTSDRVYRAAFDVGEALELLRAGRGSQFDPNVLDAFLGLDEALLGRPRAVAPERGKAPATPRHRLGAAPGQPVRDGEMPEALLARAAAEAVRAQERIADAQVAIVRALARLCETIGEHLLASVYTLEHGRLWCAAQHGYNQVRDGFELDQGVLGRTVRTGEIQFLPDVRVDPEFIAAVPAIVSELGLPLLGRRARGVLNVETIGVRLPPGVVAALEPLARALTRRLDAMPSDPRLDLASLARICVHASSLRSVSELSDFATRTLGRLLSLDDAQIILGDGVHEETTAFWRRPESDRRPLERSELAAIAAALDAGRLACSVAPLHEIGLSAHDADAGCVVWVPLRVAGTRLGTLVGRAARMLALDAEQAEAATLLAQHTAALIDLAQALRREQRAAITDSLSGLLNRRGFDERLREEVARATRTSRTLALVLADCDDLKLVNDASGHEAGDRVLQRFADVLREQKRVTDVAGRVGGDEFALLLPEAGAEKATAVVERLCARLRESAEQPLTASFGVAVFPVDGLTSSALLRAADRALYAAKHGGKNRLAAANVHALERLAG